MTVSCLDHSGVDVTEIFANDDERHAAITAKLAQVCRIVWNVTGGSIFPRSLACFTYQP